MRTKDERGVSPVIATILMVAITVVLAAVLYMMVIRIMGDQPVQVPNVVLGGAECGPDHCDAEVVSTSEPVDLSQFEVTVFADGQQVIAPTKLVADTDITGGGLTLRYTDVGREGKMTGGDSFRLSGISAGVTYDVVLLWGDGTVIESVTAAA